MGNSSVIAFRRDVAGQPDQAGQPGTGRRDRGRTEGPVGGSQEELTASHRRLVAPGTGGAGNFWWCPELVVPGTGRAGNWWRRPSSHRQLAPPAIVVPATGDGALATSLRNATIVLWRNPMPRIHRHISGGRGTGRMRRITGADARCGAISPVVPSSPMWWHCRSPFTPRGSPDGHASSRIDTRNRPLGRF